MNCAQYREQILESLAAEAPTYPPEVSSHHQTCPSCLEFAEAQQLLFRSIDAGLRTIANPEVPASPLPGFRVLLSRQPARVAWIPRFAVAVVFAVAVLVLYIGHQTRRREALPNSIENAQAVVTRGVEDSASPSQTPSKSAPVVAPKQGKRLLRATPSQLSVPEQPEVIVLPEERQAFARFVAKLPEENDVALALTRPAPPVKDVPTEMALLQIQTLKVTPLNDDHGE